jgi:hypothetical protein
LVMLVIFLVRLTIRQLSNVEIRQLADVSMNPLC